jgi:hypothetical protein
MHNVPKFCLISGLVAALAGAVFLPSQVYRIRCGLCGKTGWHWFRYAPAEETLLDILVRQHIDPIVVTKWKETPSSAPYFETRRGKFASWPYSPDDTLTELPWVTEPSSRLHLEPPRSRLANAGASFIGGSVLAFVVAQLCHASWVFLLRRTSEFARAKRGEI